MTASDAGKLLQQIVEHSLLLRGLQMTVFSQADPVGNERLFGRLAEAEAKLTELQLQLQAAKPQQDKVEETAKRGGFLRGRLLGEKTTGLVVNIQLQIDPLPTGAYHLMDPETDPLLTVEVKNVSRDIRRVCVKAHLEGLSATAVRTIEIEPRQTDAFNLHPTLFPERAHAITEI